MRRLFTYLVATVALIGIGIVIVPYMTIALNEYQECRRLKDIVTDERKREYLIKWAEKFANDQHYLQGFPEDRSILIDRTRYRKIYDEPFDWKRLDDKLLGMEIMLFTRRVPLSDDGSKRVVTYVAFPNGRDTMNVIVDPEFDFETFEQISSSGHIQKIDERTFLYCD